MEDTTTGDFFPIHFILNHVTKEPRLMRATGGVVCDVSQAPQDFFARMCSVESQEPQATVYPHKKDLYKEFLAVSRTALPACSAPQDALYVANVFSGALECERRSQHVEAENTCNWCVTEIVLRILRAKTEAECLDDVPRISLTWWLLYHKMMPQVRALVTAFSVVNARLAGHTWYNKG